MVATPMINTDTVTAVYDRHEFTVLPNRWQWSVTGTQRVRG